MRVAIVGAGPAGLLLANYLSRRQVPYQIDVYERRADLRALPASDARTFPLALMPRGLRALQSVAGLYEAVEAASVVVDASLVHRGKKTMTVKRPSNISLDRNALVKLILEQLEKGDGRFPGSNVCLQFGSKISEVSFAEKYLKITKADGSLVTASYDYLVACDGANSFIRRLLVEDGKLSCTEKLNPDSYKSVYLDANLGGVEPLQGGKVHGWFSEGYRVIGVPLQPEFFSGVFIFPQGEDPFKAMTETSQVYDFLKSIKLDDIANMLQEDEAQALIDRPISTQLSVTTSSLHVGDSVLVLGDAAHAVSASLGQGCNSAMEDVQIFNECLDEYGDNWSEALSAFTNKRLKDAHAVVELSHYSMPRTAWMNAELIIRMTLRRMLPSWLSKYMPKMPMEAIMSFDKTYAEALDDSRWWINRVKAIEAES